MYLVISLLAVAFFAYTFYRLYPNPVPGIPYNPRALRRPLGDLPDIKAYGKRTREQTEALFMVTKELNQPIAQLLLPSFRGPIVVLNDAREAEDIFVRRSREFDRSYITTQFFSPMLPKCTIAQETTPALKTQKRIWSDVMTTDFLRSVVAPNIRVAALELVDLWRLRTKKAEIANDAEPLFKVGEDFKNAALDVVWIAMLGSKLGNLRRRIDAENERGPRASRSNTKKEKKQGLLSDKKNTDSEATAHDDGDSGAVIQEAFEYLTTMIDAAFGSVWPRGTLLKIKMTTKYRRCKKKADDEIKRLMERASDRFRRIVVDGANGSAAGKTNPEDLDTCAMDLVIRRKITTAWKNGQPTPNPADDPAMLQELLLLLFAAHDSTADTLCWFVKIIGLPMNRRCQTTLRQAVEAAFPRTSIGVPASPSAAEIVESDIPYLDAFIEEVIRSGAPAGAVARRALVDTKILGYRIPAGTNVIMNTRLCRPLGNVPEELRSPTSRAAHEKRARGGLEGEPGQNLDRFDPGRYLVRDVVSRRDVFDPLALPQVMFGGGLRGCFGKKLAMQELRIMIVMLVLNFEFLALPDDLQSMQGEERSFRQPRLCHVKLRAL